MRILAIALSAMILSLPDAVRAQDDQTLADIRQELSVLYVEVQRLKRELSTTGAPGGVAAAGSALDRINAIEAELQRLTAKTEQLEFNINRVVSDGTNRIGDLEFRLCELESGCDISQLPETSTLGGIAPGPAANPAPSREAPQDGGAELAVGEQSDFERAEEVLASGDFQAAATLFATFAETYPVGPLTPRAHLKRGEALANLGQETEAARAYLEAFSSAPDGVEAPEALLKLGKALGALGQRDEACVTLGEVPARFPDSPAGAEALSARAELGCP